MCFRMIGLFAFLFFTASLSQAAAPKGVWNFDGNLDSANSGAALTFGATGAAQTSFDTCANFGIAALSGSATKKVMKYNAFDGGAGECLQVNANLAANGGGTKVNQYTIVMDYLPGLGADGYTTIFNTATNLSADPDGDGDFFIANSDNSLGLASLGGYVGTYTTGTWIRLAIVVDAATGYSKVYINGQCQGTLIQDSAKANPYGKDGQFALNAGAGPNFVMFANPYTGWSGDGYISSLAVYDAILPESVITALGGVTAAGLPTTANALVWESTFNYPASGWSNQYEPVKLGDISRGWIKWHPGGVGTMLDTPQYGWLDYLGGNTMTMMHNADNWNDTYFEVDLPAAELASSEAIEAVVDVKPFFDATSNTSQRLVVQLAGPTTDPNEGNLHLLPAAQVEIQLQQANDGTGNLQASFNGNAWSSLGVTSAQVSSLKLFLVYTAADTTFRGYYQLGGDIVQELAGSLVATPAKSTIRVALDTSYVNAGTYKPFYVNVDSFKVFNAKEAYVPVELSSFAAE